MTNATNTTVQNTAVLEKLDWADFDGDFAQADTIAELEEAIRAYIRECIAEGAYPKSTELLKAERNDRGTMYGAPILVTISLEPTEALEFCTAYSGGDEIQARELLEDHGIEIG